MPIRMKSGEVRKLHQERIKLVTDPNTEEPKRKELGSGTCADCGGIMSPAGQGPWSCSQCGGQEGYSYYY